MFRQGVTLNELAQRAAFPNRKLSVSIAGVLIHELARAGHEMVLYITPSDEILDHHTLAVTKDGVLQDHLEEHVAHALIHAFLVVDNPYQTL